MDIAITVDELILWDGSPVPPGYTTATMTDGVVRALADHEVTGVWGFAHTAPLEDRPAQREVLEAWCAAGHHLGNHTHCHACLNWVTGAAYGDDVKRAEEGLGDLLERAPEGLLLRRDRRLQRRGSRARCATSRTWSSAASAPRVHRHRPPRPPDDLAPAVADGRVQYTSTVTDGLDRAPEALVAMMRGDTRGKALVRVRSS